MNNKFKLAVTSIAGIILPITAFAKKAADYTPPSLISRLFSSIITIAPAYILLGVVIYFTMKIFDKENSMKKKKIFIFSVATLSIIASIWATTNALNDELWSPAIEGYILGSIIFPIAVILLNRKLKFLYRFIIAILFFAPSFGIAMFIIGNWQELGMNLGIPTTW